MHGKLELRIGGAGPGSPASDDLAQLLSATAGGDRDALHAIYEQTSARLFGVAIAILRNRDEAADVLQDAYVRVWQRAGQYDPARGAAASWLAGIVRHLALDAARARGRELPPNDALLLLPSLEPDAFEVFAAGHRAQQLRACLDKLDERSRGTIILTYLNGLSHAQVAAHLDRPLGTVKTWIRESLIRLKRCLMPGSIGA